MQKRERFGLMSFWSWGLGIITILIIFGFFIKIVTRNNDFGKRFVRKLGDCGGCVKNVFKRR